MTNHGYNVTMPARLGTQDAKAILDIMVCDALDQAGKNFLGCQLRLSHMGHRSSARPRWACVSSRRPDRVPRTGWSGHFVKYHDF